jgi:sugar phosphate isomerase/epimerase
MRSFDAALRALQPHGRREADLPESWTLETAGWSKSGGALAYEVHLPLHRRVAVSQLTTLRWSLPEALAGYRQGGLPAIGLWLRKLQERGLEQAIEEVRQSGLLVSTVGWIGGFTGGRSGSWEQAVQQGRLALWTASRVGAPAVTVITGPQRTHIRKHARRLVVQALKALAPMAARCGVKLSLQPMHPVYRQSWTFLNSLDDCLELLDQVGDPWVGLAYSPFQLCEESQLLSRVPELISRIASVHLSDCAGPPRCEQDRPLPGEGKLPLAEHVVALETAGFRGLYEIDPWTRDLWKRNPHGLIAECRRRFERLCTPAACSPPSTSGAVIPAEPASKVGPRGMARR